MGKSQSGVARDSASPIQYLSDVVGRNVAPPSEFRGAHPQFFQFFGPNSFSSSAKCSPGCIEITPRWFSLMVINNLHVGWAGSVPEKAFTCLPATKSPVRLSDSR